MRGRIKGIDSTINAILATAVLYCGKAGTSHLCDGSANSSGCVVNGSNATAAF